MTRKILLFLCLLAIPVISVFAGVAEDNSGKILLQVEDHGEAWYIFPNTNEKYYLGRPDDAFSIMRDLGLGITHEKLTTYLNSSFPKRLSGMILLDVEKNGEAYYISPKTLKGHYLGRPEDAFSLMRTLGLGASNQDLSEITTAKESKEFAAEHAVNTEHEQEEIKEQVEETLQNNFSISDSFFENVTTQINENTLTIKSNGLPDHETGTFPNSGNPNAISEQNIEKTISLNPIKNAYITESKSMEFGIALNGILFEPLTGEFYNNDRNSGWNLEWSTNELGFDFNNAHVQPDGTYHYHGNPTGLLSEIDGNKQTLIGFAADGFPIYVENLKASYRIKEGTRPDGPGGNYDGTYVEDYEYVQGLGDLDECNGITGITPEYPNGTYYYVISETFPIIGRCFYGTPDDSFEKGPGAGSPGGVGFPPRRF